MAQTGEGEFDVGPFITDQSRKNLGKKTRNPKVKELLDAGMACFMDQVAGNVEKPIRFPSATAVCKRAARKPVFAQTTAASPESSAANAFDRFWPNKSLFEEDLAMYTLTLPVWFHGDEIARTAFEEMTADPDDIHRALQRVAYRDTELFEAAHFRLQLLLQAMSGTEAMINVALERMYAAVTDTWVDVYKRLFAHYGLKLRPGIDELDLTYMLTAVAEGIGMRRLSDPDNLRLKDPAQRTSLLAKSVAAIFSACVQVGGDDRTVPMLFKETFTQNIPSR
jgi:hypothetical protein